jgi:isopentenyldiphosphate isomerase
MHCLCHVFGARVDTESMDFDENDVKMKKWVSRDKVLEMLKNNEMKDWFLSWHYFLRMSFTNNDKYSIVIV